MTGNAKERITFAGMELPGSAAHGIGLGMGLSDALIRSSFDGILAFDRDFRYTIWNPAMERISGVPAERVLGRVAFEVFPFLVETGEDRAFREALAGRASLTHDRVYSVPESGRQGVFEGSYAPLLDETGDLAGGLAVIRDVTERRDKEENRRRLTFLAELGRELSTSLDYEEMLVLLPQLLVQEIADYVILDVFTEGSEIRRAAVAHRDPALCSLADELKRLDPPKVGAPLGMGRVLRTGEPILAPEITEDQIRSGARSAHHLELLLRLRPRSSILVPLVAHGRVLGALALSITQGERRYGPADLAFAEEVAQRSALALDNARLYAEAQESARRLEAADRRKDEFLAMLAHELRNPLAAIANAGHALDRRAQGDPRMRELAAIVGRQTRHVARLVDDLLDVSRFSRGHIELRKTAFELRRAVEGAAETARPLLEQRRHALSIVLPDEPLWIEADVTRIEQVLANLLHNAAKFTPPAGCIELAARREGHEVVVAVSDNGTGISPELLPRIFDLFVQEERSLDRSQGGLGIGLTLVRTLVERHGGTVAAASDGLGRGSEITVRLPLRPAPETQEGLEAPGGMGTAAGQPEGEAEAPLARILLVEDNLDAAEALGELLRLWGHTVHVAHDGTSALAVARRNRPDVVLLDIGLPGMDGYAVAQQLRAAPGHDAMKLVAVTGYGQEADRRRATLASFDHHLVKPVDLERLREILVREMAP
ncbi:MAG TPA: ATP-binding protein [Thermoanaerobaculia bacterium]|nr:ATP-binding protein [Thermoanaerobaculia bacterium]